MSLVTTLLVPASPEASASRAMSMSKELGPMPAQLTESLPRSVARLLASKQPDLGASQYCVPTACSVPGGGGALVLPATNKKPGSVFKWAAQKPTPEPASASSSVAAAARVR